MGGSKKHGGPDLGPTRARAAWAQLGVDGLGIAGAPPGPDFPPAGTPRLTTEMVQLIQGFPPGWMFHGLKTSAYRQVGNAFPPPVAKALGSAIAAALNGDEQTPPPFAVTGSQPSRCGPATAPVGVHARPDDGWEPG